jgi:hypothetical protein
MNTPILAARPLRVLAYLAMCLQLIGWQSEKDEKAFRDMSNPSHDVTGLLRRLVRFIEHSRHLRCSGTIPNGTGESC